MKGFLSSKGIYKALMLLFLVLFGVVTIIASGGGGGDDDDDDDVPQPSNLSALNFYNNLYCGSQSFTSLLTVCGNELYSPSETWSGCAVEYPQTCYWSLFSDNTCATIFLEGTVDLYPNCSYGFISYLDNDGFVQLGLTETCPGDCGTSYILENKKQNIKILKKFPANGQTSGLSERNSISK